MSAGEPLQLDGDGLPPFIYLTCCESPAPALQPSDELCVIVCQSCDATLAELAVEE